MDPRQAAENVARLNVRMVTEQRLALTRPWVCLCGSHAPRGRLRQIPPRTMAGLISARCGASG